MPRWSLRAVVRADTAGAEQLSLPIARATPRREPRVNAVAVLLAVAALAFLLPFATVSCNGETVRFTGVELATRSVHPDPVSASAPDKGFAGDVEADGAPYALLALVCTLFGIGSAIWRGRGGGFALTATLALLVLLLDAGGAEETRIEAGFWTALAATAAAGALRVREVHRRRRAGPSTADPHVRRRRRLTSILLAGAALGAVTAVELVNRTDTSHGAGPAEVDFTTSDWAPDWSPDGTWIAFTSNRAPTGVFRIRADGSCLVRVASGYEPTWSPDGTRIALLEGAGDNRARLVTVAVDGTDRRIVAVGRFERPQWSRDGRSIYVEAATGAFTSAAFAVSLETGKATRLAPPWVAPGDRRWSIAAVSEEGPSVSPDGSRYAFGSSDDPTVGIDELGERIFVRETGESDRHPVTHPRGAGDYEPAWSPDGRRIAFQRSGEIGVVGADGADERVLTSVDGATEPAWSPDGRSIVFSRELYGGGYGDSAAALEIVAVETGAIRQLTWGPGIPVCS